jgi:hypothetical protein
MISNSGQGTGQDPAQYPAQEPATGPVDPAAHPILEFSDADLAAMLKRVVRLTAVLGVVIALILCLVMGWQTGVLFAVGAAISVGSIYEWARLIRVITARMDGKAGLWLRIGSRGGGLPISGTAVSIRSGDLC